MKECVHEVPNEHFCNVERLHHGRAVFSPLSCCKLKKRKVYGFPSCAVDVHRLFLVLLLHTFGGNAVSPFKGFAEGI